ncbi:AAA family ATPase [Methylobacterium sp. E-045]|uniref:AAA family ATPase n=1 Tax=Methylobacterium sp. E-045 TaxID=2836575 RepID=UPI001FBB5016|nr:AAA family ATPase [Methylobacterium sp. E-045]MCJ2127299.1 AAA family ATPase [Methylobacterium sp. E-045]
MQPPTPAENRWGTPQRVVGLIGCPGAGKTTFARRFDPLDGWVHLTLDDLRQSLWPPDRRVYWQIRQGSQEDGAGEVLHRVKEAALEAALANGFSVVMADTHLARPVFERELTIVARHGLTVEWKVFDVPWDVLKARNAERGRVDPSHRQPEEVLRFAYDAFGSPDAWWRGLPPEQVEILPCRTE